MLKNVFDSIEQMALKAPNRPAVLVGANLLSFAGLVRLTGVVAHRLGAAGIKAGDVVMINTSQSLPNLLLMFALARLGAVSTPRVISSAELAAQFMQRCNVSAVIGAKEDLEVLKLPAAIAALDPSALLAPPGADSLALQTLAVEPQTPWRVALSSGTGRMPKSILWSHLSSILAWQALVTNYNTQASDRVFIFMDVGSNFAVNQCLRVLSTGALLVLPVTVTLSEFFKCIDYFGVTETLINTPNANQIVDQLLKQKTASGRRFPSLKQISVGGERMSPLVQSTLRELVCNNLINQYGSSETGMLARADAEFMDQHPSATGPLVEGVTAQALDESGNPVPTGQFGKLRFRCPGMASAYLGEPELSAEVFKDGWFHSSDMGVIDEGGIVTIGSRFEDMLQVGGKLVDPQRIERVFNSMPGVEESVVFMAVLDTGVNAIVGLFSGPEPLDPQTLMQKCQSELGPELTPRHIAQLKEIPRNRAGKVSRKELSQRVRWNQSQAKPVSLH